MRSSTEGVLGWGKYVDMAFRKVFAKKCLPPLFGLTQTRERERERERERMVLLENGTTGE